MAITAMPDTAKTTWPELAALAPREREVLVYLAQGFTSAQTARRMGISSTTVTTYIGRLYEKLQAPTRAHLIRFAVEHGL
jgi:DNA-binding CsgD family transcriptional regulator